MDAVKYLKEKIRMCYKQEYCTHCPLNTDGENCSAIEKTNAEQAVEIVEKWSAENPQKTMLQDFLEKYPNAKTDSKGEPKTCCVNLGYKKYDECDLGNCNSCWNRPLEG